MQIISCSSVGRCSGFTLTMKDFGLYSRISVFGKQNDEPAAFASFDCLLNNELDNKSISLLNK